VTIEILENQFVSVEQFDIVQKNIKLIIVRLSELSKYTLNHTLKKIIFYLVSVFHFVRKWLWSGCEPIENNKRFLQLIISELNDFGLAYCIPPKYDFFSLLNTEFSLTDYENNFDVEYSNLLISLEKNNKVSLVNLDIKTFNESYKHTFGKFFCFNNVIKLSCEGKMQTIGDIFLRLKSSIFSTTFLFEFYDILYKSAIAATVYNTVLLLKNDINSNLNFETLKLKQDYLSFNEFPETLKKFINEFNSKLNSYMNRDIPQITEEYLIELCAKLMELGIFV